MTVHAATIHADIAALLPRLRCFARAIAYNREDGDDLVQVALERALSRAGQWEEGTRLDSWLFRIMKNAWIDKVRSRMRRDQVFAPEELGEPIGDAFAEAHQQRITIQKAMSLLPDDHGLVLGLGLVDGMAYREAAGVLEVPMGTLTSRLARAREALQGLLSDQARTVA